MDCNWHMNTTGGTRHVTQAISVVSAVGPGSDGTVNYNGAIGVNENGDVEGTEILDPVKSGPKTTSCRSAALPGRTWTRWSLR